MQPASSVCSPEATLLGGSCVETAQAPTGLSGCATEGLIAPGLVPAALEGDAPACRGAPLIFFSAAAAGRKVTKSWDPLHEDFTGHV